MRKYEKYKDSGIEWVGEIPINWDKLKIGRTFHKIGSGTTPNTNRDEYYVNGNINWLNTGDLNDTYINDTNKKITKVALNEISTLREFEEDSIVIALYGATIGKLGHLKIKTSTNQACCVLSDSEKIKNRFLFYCLLTARDFIISKSYGGGQPNISQELIKQLYLPAPSLSEQTQISRYLDHQTAIIDSLIAKKEKLVALLKEQRQAIINEAVTKGLNPKAKMKDSGIEWLGEVPEDWEVVKLKYLVSINSNEETSNQNSEVFKVALENIESETGRYLESSTENQFEGVGNNFVKGDVLFNKLRPYLSKVYLANCNGLSVGELLVLSPNSQINSEFLFYRLLSPSFIEVVNSSTYGAKMPRANWNFIGNLPIPVPNILVQVIITKRLNEYLSKHDRILELSINQIGKLKEYRQSIISEAVTGKVDVRDWQPAEKKLAT